MDKITDKNYELWLLRYAEGELDDAQRLQVEAWLDGHPDAAAELALYARAPRLEADGRVRYAGAMPGRTRRLWPVALRWAAAAAVVVAVAVPLLRMGGTDGTGATRPTKGEVVAVAEVPRPQGWGSAAPAARPRSDAEATNTASVRPASLPTAPARPSVALGLPSAEVAPATAPTSAEAMPAAGEAPLRPEVVNVGTLIAIEEEYPTADYAAAEAPVSSDGLIAVDNTADLGDLLLAANTMLRSELEASTLGQLAMRTLPDNERLHRRVVTPMRERRASRRHGRREDRGR